MEPKRDAGIWPPRRAGSLMRSILRKKIKTPTRVNRAQPPRASRTILKSLQLRPLSLNKSINYENKEQILEKLVTCRVFVSLCNFNVVTCILWLLRKIKGTCGARALERQSSRFTLVPVGRRLLRRRAAASFASFGYVVFPVFGRARDILVARLACRQQKRSLLQVRVDLISRGRKFETVNIRGLRGPKITPTV